MPGRKIPLVIDQIYHVLNRGSASQPVFVNKRNYQRGLETVFYYQNQKLPLSYSRFLNLSGERRQEILKKLREKRNFLVEIVAYCLMPNHLHLLLKQSKTNGIATFMSKFTNSYTRYFNTTHQRTGPLFQGKFKAVRVGTDEQLLHVSRYIHLSPYSSFVVKSFKELNIYPYSSLPEYLGHQKSQFCDKEIILGQFKNAADYKQFILDQADYQQRLEQIKHLALEK